MKTGAEIDLPSLIGPVARKVIGEPNADLSSEKELCFGTHGSLKVKLSGDNRGTWYDHEHEIGGGVLDLLREKKGVHRDDAFDWLRENKIINASAKMQIVASYPYHGEDGALLYEAVRLLPKTFRLRRPDGAGKWVWSLKGVDRILYRLPELISSSIAVPVFIAEGEKDVDNLRAAGLIATCNPEGAGKWRPHFSKHLAGRHVVILPDNDQTGENHAQVVAQKLKSWAAEIRILKLPGLSAKGDVSDWLASGGTAERLLKLTAAEPVAEPAAEEDAGSESPDDYLILAPGNPIPSARAFIKLQYLVAGTRTLHHQNAAFYRWKNSHYVEHTGEVMLSDLYKFLEPVKRIDEDRRIVPFAPNKTKVANVLEALRAEAQLPSETRPPAWLDDAKHPDAAALIACGNGLLDLATMTLHPLTPAFFSLNALEFAYDPAAPHPDQWLQFLCTIWPDDAEAIRTLQELFGLLLTADTRHQKAFLIVGPKRSGKGTIARVLTQLLGAANVCAPTLSSVGTNFGIAPLIGKRLALIADARLSGKADQSVITERLLSITGEDGQTVDRKFRDAWFGKLDVRFVIMTNELPKLNDSSGALAGRFIVLKMTQSFYGREDLGLGARLSAELPGILLWAIEGWKRLTARGYFITPKSSTGAQEELEDLGSPIGAFIRERCEVTAGKQIEPAILYLAWCNWCREQGRDHFGTVQTFGRDLSAAVPGLTTTQLTDIDGSGRSVRRRYFVGIRLKNEAA